jgi:hypothetical protein
MTYPGHTPSRRFPDRLQAAGSVAWSLVDALARHRVPRALGAGVALLIVIAVGAGAVILVAWGVANQHEEISKSLNAAVGKLHSILTSAGVNGNATEAAKQSVRHSAGTLLVGWHLRWATCSDPSSTPYSACSSRCSPAFSCSRMAMPWRPGPPAGCRCPLP